MLACSGGGALPSIIWLTLFASLERRKGRPCGAYVLVCGRFFAGGRKLPCNFDGVTVGALVHRV